MSRIPVYAFFSVKGGVGKSALAIAAALGFARQQRPVAVLDADFTGTSLADGLALQAPDLLDASGDIRWNSASKGALPLDESRRLRRFRQHAKSPQVPFLNDVVFGRRERFDPAAIAWSHEDAPYIRWYPSSPSPRDTEHAVHDVFAGDAGHFVDRLARVVEAIGKALGPNGVVLIDLPPGMFGVPTAVTAGLEGGLDNMAVLTPILVTTPDRNDLYRCTEEYVRLRIACPHTRWILNRNTRTVESARKDLRSFLGEQWSAVPVEADLRDVGWSGEGLGTLYQHDRLRLPDEVTSRMVKLLEGR